MKKIIVELLIDLFDRINIQTPSNFDEIVEFISNDIKELDTTQANVEFSFRKWIESNETKTYQVWMIVEEHDEVTDTYTDYKFTQKSLGKFNSLEEAQNEIAKHEQL